MFRNSNESVPDLEAGVLQVSARTGPVPSRCPTMALRIAIYFLLVLFSSETLFQCLVYLVFIVSIF
jgi:hypothetical protein